MAKRRHRRRRHWGRTFVLLVFLAAAVYAGIHCWYHAPEIQDPAPDADAVSTSGSEETEPTLPSRLQRKEQFYTMLLSGVDDGNGGSDTNILLGVDAANGRIHGVSIPRDTKAIINGKSRKINYAYNIGGPDKLAEVLTEQLGIPVDYTVTVNLKGFIALVDAIGGVDFDVPINMNYDDPLQGLSIHFRAGMQHLNGQQAMEVVRFRENNDGSGYGTQDIGRMETQQKFLKTVAKQTLTLSNADKIGQFAKLFQEYVDTKLTVGELAWFGGEALKMGADNISFSTLPGVWKKPFIHVDKEGALELVNAYLNPYVEDRTMEDLNIPD